MSAKPEQLDIYRTSIPMRDFEHAAASRNLAEAIVVRLRYSDGLIGWGETLPRKYVTGETLETVAANIEEVVWPKCLADDLLCESDHMTAIPASYKRRCINAAAAALDVASLRRVMHDLHNIPAQRLGKLASRARLRTYIDSTASGVLASIDPARTAKRLRLMRLFGLRDFKLKLGLGDDIDRANLQVVHKQIRRLVKSGGGTLRVDINGGWDAETTPERIAELQQYGVCVVEQPVFCTASKFLALAKKCELPLMADESILTERHAKTLSAEPEKVWWNLRISKNGGLLPTLKLMQMAHQASVPFTLGCMVGESSILSAAQRRLLQLGPVPRFVEGNYGRFLLSDDLLKGRRSLSFGYGGKLRTLKGDGLGIEVAESKIKKYGKLIATLQA
ncbi:MAG: hypothetical protein K8S55_15200 [Phycisphaerae bacterium]|nr:hypothetical protein [Phycisphaerae bacterium]